MSDFREERSVLFDKSKEKINSYGFRMEAVLYQIIGIIQNDKIIESLSVDDLNKWYKDCKDKIKEFGNFNQEYINILNEVAVLVKKIRNSKK